MNDPSTSGYSQHINWGGISINCSILLPPHQLLVSSHFPTNGVTIPCPKDTKGASHFVITQDIFLSYLPYFSNCRGFGRTIPWGCLQKKHLHPPKFNLEPENKSLFQRKVHLETISFRFHVKFRGCITSVFFYDQSQCSVVRTDFLWASGFACLAWLRLWTITEQTQGTGPALVFVEQKNWVVVSKIF